MNLKDKIDDNELDLSMSDIRDVPVKDIAFYKRVTSLDLSSNNIVVLSTDFAPSLTRLIKLDLSHNELQILPDNFGELRNLRDLDLYNNKLQHLPLSLGQCKLLRWLDLKNNPLVPAISEVAGPCLDAKQCQMCAKKIVPFLHNMQEQINQERERRNAQRKRNMEQKESQQIQQKKEQQKNNKKALKAEKKQKKGDIDQSNDKNTKSHSDLPNGNSQQHHDTSKRSFISQLFILLILATLLSAVFAVLLIKYDEPSYLVVQKYIGESWMSMKKMIPLVVIEKFNGAMINLYLIAQSLSNNLQTVFNTAAAKAYEYYKIYFNEEFINGAFRGLYETYAYTTKLVVDCTNNFIKELPEIIDVMIKRLTA